MSKTSKLNSFIPQGFTLGFLGSGQLARMMALSCHQLGLEPHVLVKTANDPAAQVTPKIHYELESLFESCDAVTFESEFVDANDLDQLPEAYKSKIFPSIDVLNTIQFRHSQKKLLQKFKIPTLDFIEIKSPSDLSKAFEIFKGPFVIKKSFGGYDGYGTYYSDRKDDLRKLQELLNADHVFIAEPKAKLSKELATVFVRDRWGNADHFPLVETIQQDSKCSIVIGPQHHKDFKKLSAVIFKMLKSINYVGCLGVEMFLINGKLVVNELAPRVHNTGHYTQDACQNSQFELHVRACAGMKLPKIKLIAKNFCMANLLGTQSAHVSIPADYQGSLHLYGKDLSQLGRKMGHINWVDTDSPAVLKSKAIKQRKFFKL